MNPVLLIILTVLIPPLGVFLKDGAGKQFLINLILLFVTFYVGALIHGLWVVTKKG